MWWAIMGESFAVPSLSIVVAGLVEGSVIVRGRQSGAALPVCASRYRPTVWQGCCRLGAWLAAAYFAVAASADFRPSFQADCQPVWHCRHPGWGAERSAWRLVAWVRPASGHLASAPPASGHDPGLAGGVAGGVPGCATGSAAAWPWDRVRSLQSLPPGVHA